MNGANGAPPARSPVKDKSASWVDSLQDAKPVDEVLGMGKATLNAFVAPFKAMGQGSQNGSGEKLSEAPSKAAKEAVVRKRAAWTADEVARANSAAAAEMVRTYDSMLAGVPELSAVNRATWAAACLALHLAALARLNGDLRLCWPLLLLAPAAVFTALRRRPRAAPPPPGKYVPQRSEPVFPTLLMLDVKKKHSKAVKSKAVAGSTTHRASYPGEAGTWEPTVASRFKLRGPDYLRDKKKFASPEALYEPFAVDILRSVRPTFDLAARVELPEKLPHELRLPKWCPRILVQNMYFPGVPPPLFSQPEPPKETDPAGWHVVCYWRVCAATVDLVCDVERELWPAHLKLWRQYATRAATSPVLNGCLKGVAQVDNIDEPGLGLPRLVRQYNGKPVLMAMGALVGVRPGCVVIEQGDENDYIEFDINVGTDFAAMSNHAVFALKDKFQLLLADIGWVVEGRANDELPEGLLAALRLNYFDLNKAVDVADFFSGGFTVKKAPRLDAAKLPQAAPPKPPQ